MTVLALYSIKGGVGKTSSAVNLALLAAREGARTLLCDLDPQGAATFHFRVQTKVPGGAKRLLRKPEALADSIKATDFDRLDLLPADFSFRNFDVRLDREPEPRRGLTQRLAAMRGEYDVVVLDCAPGASLVSENVFAAADALLVPAIPTVLSLRTLARLLQHLTERSTAPPRVLPFFTMLDRRKALHRKVVAWSAAHDLGFLEARIPYSSTVEQMSVRRAPLQAFAPSSPPARAYAALWTEVRSRLESERPTAKDPAAVREVLDELRDRR